MLVRSHGSYRQEESFRESTSDPCYKLTHGLSRLYRSGVFTGVLRACLPKTSACEITGLSNPEQIRCLRRERLAGASAGSSIGHNPSTVRHEVALNVRIKGHSSLLRVKISRGIKVWTADADHTPRKTRDECSFNWENATYPPFIRRDLQI